MFWKMLYNILLFPVFRVFLVFFFFGNEKIREGFTSRSGIWKRFFDFSETLSQDDRVYWFHATSVGEFEQARPLIEVFKEQDPSLKIVLTFFSPSGFRYAGNYSFADYVDYLPFDSYFTAKSLLSRIKPKAFIYVKFDIWPNWTWCCKSLGIPVLIANATLSDKSRRHKSWLMRSFYRSIYRDFNYIGTVSESDAENFIKTDSDLRDRISVVGDTRYDQVARRKKDRKAKKIYMNKVDKFVLLLGSVWPEDNRVIMPAVASTLKRYRGNFHVVIVPHEPDERHVGELMHYELTKSAGLVRYSEIEKSEEDVPVPECVVVDKIGILPELYSIADAAYVGGSFSTGVHNVIEPSIMGLPVMCGPVMNNAPEAQEMQRHGLLSVIKDEKDLEEVLSKLVENSKFRAKTGNGLMTFVENRLGATQKYFTEISRVLHS